jgi:hypothetical protein
MSADRRTVNECVQSSARTLPEALAYQLLTRRNRMETPTADSRIFVARPSTRAPLSAQRSRPPQPQPLPRDPDATPTWRPPKKADERSEEAQLLDSFANDEHESTVRDRVPRALLPSDNPPAEAAGPKSRV